MLGRRRSSIAVSWSATVTLLPGATITNAVYTVAANDQGKKPGPPVSTPVSYTAQPLDLDGTATPSPARSLRCVSVVIAVATGDACTSPAAD